MVMFLCFGLVKPGYAQVTHQSLDGQDSVQLVRSVDSLLQLAMNYRGRGKADLAFGVIASAEKIAIENFGINSSEYGKCCNFKARIYCHLGQYPIAENWAKEACFIIEKAVGKHHPTYATALGNLGVLYMEMGSYEQSESLQLEAKLIRGLLLDPSHRDYLQSLNNLGVLYKNVGQFETAETFLKESLSLREKNKEEDPLSYARSLNNLAVLYIELGIYEKAEPLLLETKVIRGDRLGKDHVDYGNCLTNLALVYLRMNNAALAELYLSESKNVIGRAMGVGHSNYAEILINMASLYLGVNKPESALHILTDASAIWSGTLGRKHALFGVCQSMMALACSDIGQYTTADSLFAFALNIKKKSTGYLHPSYASTLLSWGHSQLKRDQFDLADSFYSEAKVIIENSIGKLNAEYREILPYLSRVYSAQKRYTLSDDMMKEAIELEHAYLLKAASFLSERELASSAIKSRKYIQQIGNSILYRMKSGESVADLAALSSDLALIQKGFVLTSASKLRGSFIHSSEASEINNRLKGYRRRLARAYAQSGVDSDFIYNLEERANEVEKELIRLVLGYEDEVKSVKWHDVKNKLRNDEMAIEFIHFPLGFPEDTGIILYAALLINKSLQWPIFIPLFESKEFDHLFVADKERKSDYVNELYAWADRGMVKLGGEKKSLYELIWSKMEAEGLEGIKTVYYSPSGVLHRLNLGAIAVDEETILSDRYNLVALNSTRQLVIPSSITAQANDALLVGGVQFEWDSIQATLDDPPLLASRSAADSWTESGSRGGVWSYLKWTEREVERISTTLTTGGFKTSPLNGSDATEEAIKAIGTEGPSPRILHIATHGFFFPDPEATSASRGLGEAEPVFKLSDNPMIRSGLILAGGNYAWQHGRPVSPDREDGILTAYEITQMNLANTELVVLSACETGLGDIQGNEGVYGLQRAFKIAGAKYLIMSLWQVPDRETMEFMTAFYRNWLESQMTIPDAFRKTQREMRDRFINPYSWGAFVLVE
jgi:CHAT domain-containing protein/tetratricopeptide (TPR) repeat protein